jgi:hypothetical protein
VLLKPRGTSWKPLVADLGSPGASLGSLGKRKCARACVHGGIRACLHVYMWVKVLACTCAWRYKGALGKAWWAFTHIYNVFAMLFKSHMGKAPDRRHRRGPCGDYRGSLGAPKGLL